MRGRQVMAARIGYRWHLRRLMADKDMYATTDLRPLLADRGIALSREQVYRLVARTPERLSLATLAALCDILGCGPGDLVEPVTGAAGAGRRRPGSAAGLLPRPVRAQVAGTQRR
jgi:DNA-binding Xre family transcriptional regulator